MTRQRPIQGGYVYRKGPSWFVQWREDFRNAAGEIERRKFKRKLCPAVNERGKEITQREAERIAWEEVLSPINTAAPFLQSLLTVAEFWERRFVPEWIWTLKAAGKKHYTWAASHILPALGSLTLREVSTGHIQALIHKTIESGASVQTAAHLRNACSALFRHAAATGTRQGDNPAQGVRLPPMVRKRRPVLTFTQARQFIAALPEPVSQMARLSMLTSMNVAEMIGLTEEWINTTPDPSIDSQGEVLPPQCAAVRENVYRGARGTVKTAKRRRIVPLTPELASELAALIARNKTRGPQAPVFQNSRGGLMSETNAASRTLRPVSARVLGFTVSWHVFRHCTATWAELVSMPMSERQQLLGHARASMTLHYTHADMDRRRGYVMEMEKNLNASPIAAAPPPEPEPEPANQYIN